MKKKLQIDDILQQEAYLCYKFLIDSTIFDENHPGCGLTLDRSSRTNLASVASSGFMLSALVIGVERGYDSYEINYQRALVTLKNFYKKVPQYEGMFVHFVDTTTGMRFRKCEYSTIDTVLFLNGVLTIDAYFQTTEIHDLVMKIYNRVNWNKFTFERNGHLQFRMAYNDIKGGDYLDKGDSGWIHHWSMMAEQLAMYLLAAGSDNVTKEDAIKLFLGFERYTGGYKGDNYIYSPLGALFVHQYSHAWIDFNQYYDTKGFDWFNNSVKAVHANYQYCQDLKNKYITFNDFWGLSACDGPKGYAGYGNPPFGWDHDFNRPDLISRTDGTVAIYAMLASLPFASEIVKTSTEKIYYKYPEAFGPYGFYDSVNLENGTWIGKDYIGIDKGITLLMIDNYYHKTVWSNFMKNKIIKKGIEKLDFVRKGV